MSVTAPLPARMRAMRLRRFGEAADAFEPTTLPVPVPGPGEVLIRVVATSVNPADVKIRRHGGPLAPASGVLGMDVAGEVVAVGAGVTGFERGDRVFGCAGGVGALQGALAEFLCADARLIAPAPRTLSLREAAALPLVAITAFEGLFDRARVAAGDQVLVTAAVGGVGHVAVQLAAAAGAHVTAVVSTLERAALARSLGAREVTLRGEETLEQARARVTDDRGFDVVFDASGQDQFAAAFAAARPQGAVVTLVTRQTVDLSPMHAKGLSMHAVFMLVPMIHGIGRERHGGILHTVSRAVDEGALRPLVDPHRYRLDDIAAAHARLEAGGVQGKLVVDVSEE